jgi:prepilin-type processing-associated H-X9-DG protein
LVELVVVLGIIAVLIAILLPAVIGVRKQAQAAVCGSNLRSLGQALALYTQRFGYYPSCGLIDDSGSVSHVYAIWPVRLRLMTGGDQGVFNCPAQGESCEWRKVPAQPGTPGRAAEVHTLYGYDLGEPLIDSYVTPFSYGYNATGTGSMAGPDGEKGLGNTLIAAVPSGAGPNRELRANRVRKPAEMIALTDSTADGAGDFLVDPNPASMRVLPGRVHNRGANVLFCDGHVQWYPQKDLLVTYNVYVPAENNIRRMWNNDHKVNAGIQYDREDGG